MAYDFKFIGTPVVESAKDAYMPGEEVEIGFDIVVQFYNFGYTDFGWGIKLELLDANKIPIYGACIEDRCSTSPLEKVANRADRRYLTGVGGNCRYLKAGVIPADAQVGDTFPFYLRVCASSAPPSVCTECQWV